MPPSGSPGTGPSRPHGTGAQAGSNRREYRKFRGPYKPVPKPKPQFVQGEGAPEGAVEVEAPKKRVRVRACRYFNTKKGCMMGKECPFRHVIKGEPEHEPTPSEIEATYPTLEQVASTSRNQAESAPLQVVHPPSPRSSRVVVPIKLSLKKDQLGSAEQLAAKESDMIYFKRRYRNCTIESESGVESITFKYDITDPEWVFDVKYIYWTLLLSTGHPIEQPKITVSEERNRVMPELLVRTLIQRTNEALQAKYADFEKRNSYEPIAKSLLRWIDHHVLTMFVEGLKKTKLVWEAEAAGISLVVPQKSSVKGDEKSSNTPCSSSTNEKDEASDEEYDDEQEDSESNDEDEESLEEEMTTSCKISDDVKNSEAPFKADDVPPIEVTINLIDKSPNIASVTVHSLSIETKCCRCSEERTAEVNANDKTVGWRCKKCAVAQSLRLRPCIVHENSCILGLLDARGCRPMDCVLLDSKLSFVCLECNREDDVQKISYSQPHRSWCRTCHTLCQFSVASIRFRGDFSKITGECTSSARNIPKIKKTVEVRSAIVEGQPLPDNGTCKHYKKSYRWFRFPCCGKVFACDTCHMEKAGDHEMKIANRMICGHCSKEQPFINGKPCIGCKELLMRSKSHFWEGGKGCRDQTLMNKNDVHKHTNSRQKTLTKKKTEDLLKKK